LAQRYTIAKDLPHVRINFVLPTVAMSGGTRVVGIHAQELMKRGHDVCLISPPPQQLPVREKLKSWLKGSGWPPHRSRFPSHLDELGLNHQILDVWRPVADDDVPDADIVIATWWETAEWVNNLGREKGAKVYFIQHHEVFPHLPVRSRETYRLPMHKVVVAQWLKQVMISEYDDHVVDVVPNSVDHSQFFAPVRGKQHSPTVGLLYASASFKGVDLSLAALRIVAQSLPGLRIVCFGSERVRPDLDLPDGAEFFFHPPQNEIKDLYARCDVWVTASRTEGFNLPAMEAMACRTPVVSTRTGWPEEAIRSGWNGMLVDVDDVDALARGIEWVLSQTDEAWRTLSSNAFETVAGSSWDASAAMFEEALVNARNRASRGEIRGGQANLTK
jgi:glycosyltransferase involved in cell wall biosynthesis